jgi:predicted short-subunit dehydrogenase-like oxidoreductase (DUF2520 family)
MELSEPIGIAGSGRLAQAMARRLRERGAPVTCIASRNPAHAAAAARFAGGGIEAVRYEELPDRVSRFLIAVSDFALAPVIELLASGSARAGVALHTCGARDLEDFGPLAARGFACGTLHPLQTFPDPESGAAALAGSVFAISGDERATAWARAIVDVLEGRAIAVRPGARPLYHSAAVMASNYTIALIDAARELMAMSTDAQDEEALRAIEPLIRTSVENALRCGPAAALTGPIERGDAGTVELHRRALACAPERLARLYDAAGLQALHLARRKGLSSAAADAVEVQIRR